MPRQAESRWRWARRRGYAVLRATGIVGILALGTWAPAAGQEGAEARVTADRLNFREECGRSSPVLGVLTRDETVTVLGSELGTWIRVRDEDGVEGCVSAQYLEIDPAPAEAESMATPSEDPSPYAWADLTDPDSAEIVSELEELKSEFAATSDPEDQEDLRQEITELEDDLRARQQELAEEREEAAREAGEAELPPQQATQGQRMQETSRAARSASGVTANWTGFHVGVSVGYGFGDEVAATNSLGSSPAGDIDGVDGGLQFGYDYQFNRFVLGGEVDYQFSSQSGESDLGSIGFPGSSIEEEYQNFGSARVRVGYGGARFLLYATGGYAFLESDVSFSGPIANTVAGRSTDADGWVVGAGVESRLARYISLKLEALYHEVEDEAEAVEGEFTSVRAGLNWRF